MPILLHRVLAGYDRRKHELAQEDYAKEHAARRQYLDHLNKRLDEAIQDGDEDVVEWITAAREKVHTADPTKPFKPQVVPLPSRLSGKPPKGAGGAGGAGSAGGANAQTPPDIATILRHIATQNAAKGTPGASPDDGGAGGAIIPPMRDAEGGPPLIVPPVGAQGFGGAPSTLPAQAATPPGRSAPEASPLTPGVVPGMTPPSPIAGTNQNNVMAPPDMSTPPSMGPEPTAVRRSRIAGRADVVRQAPVLALKQRMVAPPSASVIAALAKDYRVFEQTPDGTYTTRPMTDAELALHQRSKLAADRSKIDTDTAQRTSMSIRDKVAVDRAALLAELGRDNLAARREATAQRRDASTTAATTRLATAVTRSTQSDLKNTMAVARAYERSVKVYRDAERNMAQVRALGSSATGPADYALILSFVHNIDDTAAREGEVALARSAANLATRLEQWITRMATGELLASDVREQFFGAAEEMNAAVQEQRVEIDDQYGVIADDFQLDRRKIGLPGGGGDSSVTPSSARRQSAPTSSAPVRTKRDPVTGRIVVVH